ncbi:MAG: RNA polymerase subunit sigma-24 [Burkholderiales bacterium]|uniref:RNA polymerase sigma factor n=1 Tax=Inhella sp. TaxID=1921806 RepID=UPI001AC3FBFA|nr:RNA polymerase subunit sigma-24 [Burkholderiales bacterium]
MSGPAAQDISAVWRLEAPRCIGALTRLGHDLALAEDCMQDALEAALQRWPAEGWPLKPGAWLMTTAKHRLLDRLRHAQMAAREQLQLGLDLDAREAHLSPDPLTLMLADEANEVGEDALRLMFIACHPKLAREAQWALTLRLVGGLSVAEIARALFAKEATVAQRISRAKAQLSGEAFELPPAGERAARLAAVCTVLYLMFNEGYAATQGEQWTRPALCHEALRLARHLAALLPADAEVLALQALMELQAARLPARADAQGRPVLLDSQDRRRWDRLLLRRGLAALARCRQLHGGNPGAYALQAELAAVHAQAPCFEDTDWRRLVQLYDALLEAQPSPVVELNRAVALARARGAAQALPLVERLTGALAAYPWLHSVRADLLLELGRTHEAGEALRRAIALCANQREQSLLRQRLMAVESAAAESSSHHRG